MIAGKPRSSSEPSCRLTRATWPRWSASRLSRSTADKPWDAERLLRHALKQAAHVPLALRGLGPALIALGRVQEAEEAARRLLLIEPENPQSWVTEAAVATRLLQQERALEAFEKAAALKPDEELIRLSIGHAQKTLGRRADSETSYKAALAINPAMGAAYWSLADLKNYVFSDAEISAMQALLRQELPRADAAQLHFALGKAFEHRQRIPRRLRALRARQRAAPPG